MNNNNLGMILNPTASVNNGIFNFSSSIMEIKFSERDKIIRFFNKNIKIAIKPDKVKIGIGHLIITSANSLNNFTYSINVPKTYVATVKKSFVISCDKLCNKFDNLKKLVENKEEQVKVDNFFVDIEEDKNSDDILTVTEPFVIPTTNNNVNASTSTPVSSPEVAPVDFGNVSLDNLANTNINENIPTFNMSAEDNLQSVMDPELNKINDLPFGQLTNEEKDNIYKTANIDLSTIPSQTIDRKITEENGIGSAGYIKSKLLAVLIVILFIGSCVFLGYELTKINELMPQIKDKYFS